MQVPGGRADVCTPVHRGRESEGHHADGGERHEGSVQRAGPTVGYDLGHH